MIRGRPNTTFVGEQTAGSTGQPLFFALPGGAVGVLCSVRTLAPNGRAFVGTGFEPDVKVGLTQEDLLRGRDRMLEKAIAVFTRGAH